MTVLAVKILRLVLDCKKLYDFPIWEYYKANTKKETVTKEMINRVGFYQREKDENP